MPVNNQKISGETPFKPEYDEFINEYRGRGSLKVQTSVAREAFPIKNAFVDVALIYKGKRYSIYNDVTDNSGIESAALGEPEYLISVFHPGFEEIIDAPVVIHDRVETILPLSLNPCNGQTED